MSLKRIQSVDKVDVCLCVCRQIFMCIFYHGTTVPSGPGPPHYRGFTTKLRHTTVGWKLLEEWSADAEIPDNTQHSKQTDINAPGGIQTRNPSKRAALDHTAAGIDR
jgi:hypothetical protein